jgi:hypothetical protein
MKKREILELTVSKCQGYIFYSREQLKIIDSDKVIFDHEVGGYVEMKKEGDDD